MIAKMLRGRSAATRLYNEDQRGGFRDEHACNRDLKFGPDFGGQEEGSYLPAHRRYIGRFFSSLCQEARSFWDDLPNHPVEVLFVSGLYGLLFWDELIQDYDCHFSDYTKDKRREAVSRIWGDTLTLSLLDVVKAQKQPGKSVAVFDLLSELAYQKLFDWERVAGSGARIHHRIFKNLTGPDILQPLATILATQFATFLTGPNQSGREKWYLAPVRGRAVQFGFEYPIGDNPQAAREDGIAETTNDVLSNNPEFSGLPRHIRHQIALAEHSWRSIDPSREFDYGVISVSFAKAVEAYLRWVMPSFREETLGNILAAMSATPWADLYYAAAQLNDLRDSGAHGSSALTPTDVQRARALAFDVIARAERIRQARQ